MTSLSLLTGRTVGILKLVCLFFWSVAVGLSCIVVFIVSLFCYGALSGLSSFAIISLMTRELVDLLKLSSHCHVTVSTLCQCALSWSAVFLLVGFVV